MEFPPSQMSSSKIATDDTVAPPPLKRQKTIQLEIPKKLAIVSASILPNHPPEVTSYKIGHERFLYVVKIADGNIKVYLGAILEAPGISTSPRNIELTIPQFKVLCGLLLSGKAMAEINRNKDSDRLSPMYQLGENVFFLWSRWNKAEVATVRRYKELLNGDLVPTKAGFTFTEKYYDALLEIIKSMVSCRIADKLTRRINIIFIDRNR